MNRYALATALLIACARPTPRADAQTAAQPSARCTPAPVEGPVAPAPQTIDRADQLALGLDAVRAADGTRVDPALVIERISSETAQPIPPAARALELVLGAQHPRFAPAALACEALALRVDGANLALGAARATVMTTHHDMVIESLRARVPPGALAPLRAARCVTIAACGREYTLHPAQTAALRGFAARLASGAM